MPYREKTALLSLVAIAITFGPYFAIIASGVFDADRVAEQPSSTRSSLLSWRSAQMIVLGVGRFYLRQQSPEDARAARWMSVTSASCAVL